ncbi:MAG: hypothetical protein LAT62_11290 [Natronospirillum sp.]|uniref:hypothetical protein n=1 Tax=Natronospirillum sp. TaxID=2812955 RepID=UPI0025DF576D|nr:hypothetical protein [Natronospirillum sp.]MCH8552514.1 hypothetical protein [Natronospirillum sp.]
MAEVFAADRKASACVNLLFVALEEELLTQIASAQRSVAGKDGEPISLPFPGIWMSFDREQGCNANPCNPDEHEMDGQRIEVFGNGSLRFHGSDQTNCSVTSAAIDLAQVRADGTFDIEECYVAYVDEEGCLSTIKEIEAAGRLPA